MCKHTAMDSLSQRNDAGSSDADKSPHTGDDTVRSAIALEVKAVLEQHSRHIAELLRQSQNESICKASKEHGTSASTPSPSSARMLMRRAAL